MRIRHRVIARRYCERPKGTVLYRLDRNKCQSKGTTMRISSVVGVFVSVF